jgi:DNA-binding HxlR family transcriptional regulator
MGRTDDKVGYQQKSSYPGITPDIAASGVDVALKVLEGRWKLIILFYLLRDGTLRLSELERAIPGITQKMLIQQLRSMERDGVVSRLVHPVVPPKVEYSLTPRGQDLCPALDELLYWAQRWKGQPTRPPDVPRPRRGTLSPRQHPSSSAIPTRSPQAASKKRR